MSDPVVETTSGRVRGLDRDGSTVFYSIPYAAAPIGPLTFAAPAPHSGWAGVRDATRPGATAQVRGFEDSIIPEPSFPGDEILTVNVFTPTAALGRTPDEPLKPVFVWIHGGAFIAGSPHSPWYDGVSFNRGGIIVVSVGYRLGLAGFGVVAGAPANRAVRDWIAALQWVQANIEVFGGDPNRVTIGGQSAGAAAVLMLMGAVGATSLFQQAVAASPVLLQPTREQARQTAAEVAQLLGAEPTERSLASKPRSVLADVPWRLRNAFDNATAAIPTDTDIVDLIEKIIGSVQFAPIVDGEVLHAPTAQALLDGQSRAIPLLIGATAHEFNSMVAGASRRDDSDKDALTRLGFSSDEADAYLRARAGSSGAGLIAQLLSDLMVRRWVATIAATHSPTWVYDFAWLPAGEINPGQAFHCLDLPFAWGLLDAPGAQRATGSSADSPVAATLMASVHGAWVSFIKSGDPGWPTHLPDHMVHVYDSTTVNLPNGLEAERDIPLDASGGFLQHRGRR